MTAAVLPVRVDRPTSYSTVGFANVLRSEWTKLRSVRSTYWTVGICTLAAFLLAGIVCAHWASSIKHDPSQLIGFDPVLNSLDGLYLGQVAIGALGVMMISSEYGTGMIRATFGAVPQRRTLLAAKALVIAASTFVIGEVLSFSAFGVGQAFLSSAHAGGSLSNSTDLRAVFGGGLYLTAVALLGFGLGALIRHTAGALSAFFGLMFATSVIVDLLPTSWRNDVIKFMPSNAGSQIVTTVRTHDSLSTWTGFGVLCLYPAVVLLVAFLLVNRRDA